MTNEDKVLLETRFRQKGMTDDEFNRCLAILLESKDISNSAYNIEGNSKLDIVEITFKKSKDNEFEFNGSLSLIANSDVTLENRSVNGVITFKGKKVYILLNVYRYSECEHKNYEVGEILEEQKTHIQRTTFYQYLKAPFVDKIKPLSEEEILEYKENFIKGLKL